MSNQSPRRWVFATPFCVRKCHIWVKLCAEQLCGFCTSRSPIGCGKLLLQLVISQFDMPPLYLYIIIPFTRIESKIAQWQNQSAKLATTKHIMHLTMQKTHMHGAKESHNSMRGMKPPVLTASMEWGIHSSPTWMIGWPLRFNKAFVTSKNNIDMADCK